MGLLRRSPEPSRIIWNPTASELRQLAAGDERTTIFGSPSYTSRVRNRSAKNTFIVTDGSFPIGIQQQAISPEAALEVAARVHGYLRGQTMIAVDRVLGRAERFRFKCRLYITKDFARIPYMWQQTLFPPDGLKPGHPADWQAHGGADGAGSEPDLLTIYVPEWPERLIFVAPEERVTYILGTDYFGECKKSFLRMAMYEAKRRGALGFHAGSKVLRVRPRGGERSRGSEGVKEVGFLLFGLSGTGKTTLTIHDHGLFDASGDGGDAEKGGHDAGEGIEIRQDDVVLMDETGFCAGTENGFFIKTEGLEPSQRVLYEAATRPTAIFENIAVKDDGSIDFEDVELTANGRGVLARAEVAHTGTEVDLAHADKIIFITRRNDIVPAVAKLDARQASAFFMLGESVETSAGDPTRAGQAKREVGTNPFIIGPEEEEGNRFLEILRKNPDIECYLLNTGSVGARAGSAGKKITVHVSATIMKEIARGTIQWRLDEDWGYLVPAKIPGIDIAEYDPRRYYAEAEYAALTEKLRAERRAWLAQFAGLADEIRAAVEPPCRGAKDDNAAADDADAGEEPGEPVKMVS